jgi:hypothetical protein
MTNPEYQYDPMLYLTAEEAAALEAGPGLVTERVAIELIAAEDYLREGMNGYHDLGNFSGHFIAPDSMIAAIYHERACRQRFASLFPDLTAELEQLNAEGEVTNAPTSGRTLWRPHAAYLQAYDLMSVLVDRNDPAVVRPNGTVDSLYLVR